MKILDKLVVYKKSIILGSYVDAHLKKIDEYTALQNDYKTDRLTVKVNWDLQDSKYEYLKNQHGIYPQVKAIHRPGPYGSSYGGVPYGKSPKLMSKCFLHSLKFRYSEKATIFF